MIEINLIPDVKLQLLHARRVRTRVISLAFVIAAGSVALVVVLALYAFGALGIADLAANNSIDSESKKLESVTDLPKTLTIQNQMKQLKSMHDNKTVSSRMFDLVTTVVPTNENNVTVSHLALDTDNQLITIEGEAPNGYEALEVFKKTIAQTKFEYVDDASQQQSVNVADEITDGDRRYSENSNGDRVLRFTLSFTYPEELFLPTAQQGRIVAPDKQNATDSVVGVPKSLFSGSTDESGGTK